ncbi:MAG TPA: hypothetical protein VMW15_04825, partial [Terracidiphilus sp.]|nr:hypothetical protein [Terracidiphilus sp.]
IPDEDIALTLEWGGEPEALMKALNEAGWIDQHEKYRWIIHEWASHCQDTTHCKLARAREYFVDGSAPRLGRLGGNERDEIKQFYERTASAQNTNSYARIDETSARQARGSAQNSETCAREGRKPPNSPSSPSSPLPASEIQQAGSPSSRTRETASSDSSGATQQPTPEPACPKKTRKGKTRPEKTQQEDDREIIRDTIALAIGATGLTDAMADEILAVVDTAGGNPYTFTDWLITLAKDRRDRGNPLQSPGIVTALIREHLPGWMQVHEIRAQMLTADYRKRHDKNALEPVGAIL